MSKFMMELKHNYYFSRRAALLFLFERFISWVDRVFTFLVPVVIGVVAVVSIVSVAGAVYVHFVEGVDIPLVDLKNTDTAAYWGQIGDFVGGILNPLLSFTALMAVLYSLRAQNKELALARADAKENQRIQAQQSLIFERQNFESVFFRLLDIHSRLASEMEIEINSTDSLGRKPLNKITGLKAFSKIEFDYFPRGEASVNVEVYKERLLLSSRAMSSQLHNSLAHYFRNLYQLLKQVDGFGLDPLRASRPNARANIRALISNYSAQRNYANMLRAQLGSSELSVIFLNCLTEKGEGLKYFVERFSLLKHMDARVFSEHDSVRTDLFDEMAFADSEEIDSNKLRGHLRSRK